MLYEKAAKGTQFFGGGSRFKYQLKTFLIIQITHMTGSDNIRSTTILVSVIPGVSFAFLKINVLIHTITLKFH